MTAPKLRIRREAVVTGTVGRGIEVKNVWVVRALSRGGGPAPIIAHFPTFEQARRYAAFHLMGAAAATEPPC